MIKLAKDTLMCDVAGSGDSSRQGRPAEAFLYFWKFMQKSEFQSVLKVDGLIIKTAPRLVLFISVAEVSHVSPVSDSSTNRNHFRQDTTVRNIPFVIGRRGCLAGRLKWRGVRGGKGRGEDNETKQ